MPLKGSKEECEIYRGISLLSIPGKAYGRIIIERVRRITETKLGEEQGGFRNKRMHRTDIHTIENDG